MPIYEYRCKECNNINELLVNDNLDINLDDLDSKEYYINETQ